VPSAAKAALKKTEAKAQNAKAEVAKNHAAKTHAPKADVAKAQVFLVAVKRRREALRVYAVLTSSEAVALAIVESRGCEDATVEPVGRLSKKLARPLRLLTGEPRLI